MERIFGRRLEYILDFYFEGKWRNLIGNRINIIEGDIVEKNLGIDKLKYKEIIDKIDCIINTAAVVKHYGKAEMFERVNIYGVKNVIEFSKKYNKKLFHISTISVSSNISNTDEKVEFRESNFYIYQDLTNIYVYTKFQAEKLVLEGIKNDNLDAKIIRLGNITNRFSDGVFQSNYSENAFVNRIKTFIDMKQCPIYLKNMELEFTSVDKCTEAIAKLVQINSNYNIFHIYNNHFIKLCDLIKILEEFNIKIDFVDQEEFNQNVQKILKSNYNDILHGIVNDFIDKGKINYNSNVIVKNSFTNEILKYCYFKWPEIDEEYIRKYIKYFMKIGYIRGGENDTK